MCTSKHVWSLSEMDAYFTCIETMVGLNLKMSTWSYYAPDGVQLAVKDNIQQIWKKKNSLALINTMNPLLTSINQK